MSVTKFAFLPSNSAGATIQDKQAIAKAIGKFNKRKESYKRKKRKLGSIVLN